MAEAKYGCTFPDGTKLRVIVTTADECTVPECDGTVLGTAESKKRWAEIQATPDLGDWPVGWEKVRDRATSTHEHVYPQTFAYTLNGEDARRKSVMAAWNAQSDEARALAGLALNNLLGANE